MEQENKSCIEGTVEEIIFRNESNGYTVATLVTEEKEEHTVTGNFVSLDIGDHIAVHGQQNMHPSYGIQFRVTAFEHKEPASKEAIMAFLSSGTLEGVGRAMAERIFHRFGMDTMNILDYEPERLLEIDGIGRKKLTKIIESYKEKRDLKVAILKFSGYGITPAMATKIYRYYGSDAAQKIEKNPYCLCRDIKGIGFRKADEIAAKIGIAKDDKNRIMQGIIYLLQEAGGSGNIYLPAEKILVRGKELLGVSEEDMEDSIYELCIQGDLTMERKGENRRLYLQGYYEAENNVASMLASLISQNEEEKCSDAEEMIFAIQDKTGICLAEKQKEAVKTALQTKMMILTGGPGTGKTTVVKFILRCFEEMEQKVLLCAPTGRAAKRLSESAEKEAKTIHRLLEVGFTDDEDVNFYNRDEDNPLEAQVIIVDEMSMVDIFLMRALLRAIPQGARLIMIGDADQLPSVGAGNLLWDMIDSTLIPTITLTEIFRQKQESGIIINAHRVNHGEPLELSEGVKDFFFMRRRDGAEIQDLILELMTQRLPNYFSMQPQEIQILTPVRKGVVGVNEINRRIQANLNPYKTKETQFQYIDTIFRQGDKVMQIKNNYQKLYRHTVTYEEGEGVFNGDIGVIDVIDTEMKHFYITFDDNRRCRYEFSEADNIEHAYAITVHKSQGSEFDVIILPILSLPPMLQNRNILYTAITRAKKGLVLIGNPYYIDKMIQNVNMQVRYSSLNERLLLIKENKFEQA